MDIIKSSAEISLLFTQGRRVYTPFLTLIVLDKRDCCEKSSGRVAFIAGKKYGNAVWRNAAKRRMREVCRAAGGPFNGFDVVFLAKQTILQQPYQEVLFSVQEAVNKDKELCIEKSN